VIGLRCCFCSWSDDVYVLLSIGFNGRFFSLFPCCFFSFKGFVTVVAFGHEPEKVALTDRNLISVELANHFLQNEGPFRNVHTGLLPGDAVVQAPLGSSRDVRLGENYATATQPLGGVSPDKKRCVVCASLGSILQSIVNGDSRIHTNLLFY